MNTFQQPFCLSLKVLTYYIMHVEKKTAHSGISRFTKPTMMDDSIRNSDVLASHHNLWWRLNQLPEEVQ